MGTVLDIPWLPESEVSRQANHFLDTYHPSGETPVPIEMIVERQGIDIVPLEGLQNSLDLVGCTSADRQRIYVDRWVEEHRENRYRFTLAHEMGHIVLHGSVLDNLRQDGSDLDVWVQLRETISDSMYGSLEWQAYTFAGLILVPGARLTAQYESELSNTRARFQEAVSRGIGEAEARDFAWEYLAEQIAQPFVVSKDVILRRLRFERLEPSAL